MAIVKYIANLDLTKNELLNTKLQNLASHPTVTVTTDEGFVYWNTTDETVYVYTGVGTVWLDLGNTGVTNLSYVSAVASGTVESDTGTDATIPAATRTDGTNKAGLLEPADKQKLDDLVLSTGTNTGDMSLDTTLDVTEQAANLAGQELELLKATGATDGVMSSEDKTKLDAITGSNTGDQTIILTGDVTGSGVGSFAATIAADAVSNAKLANMGVNSVKGNATAGSANPTDIALAVDQVLGRLSGNIVGIDIIDDDTLGTASASNLATAEAIKTYIDNLLGANDAMIFKGTIGTGGTHTIAAFNALTTYDLGWTYRVVEAGTIKGAASEVGDLFISIVDRTGGSGVNADWTVAQTNIDGAVIGPSSAVNDRVALFDGTSGKLIKDSGVTISGSNTGDEVDATTTVEGVVEEATQTEVNTGTAEAGTVARLFVTPKKLEDKTMGTYTGTTITDNVTIKTALQELETAVEASGVLADASETAKGVVEEATTAETLAGTATGATGAKLVVTPTKLKGFLRNTNTAHPPTDGQLAVSLVYSRLISETTTTTVVTHSIGRRWVQVQLIEVSTDDVVVCEVELTSTTTITLKFNVAPTTNQYRVIIIG
jgi:hypothetical protein